MTPATPPAPPEATSRRMRAVARRDTAPELALRRQLAGRGLRYRIDRPPLTGLRRKADVVFVRAQVAVFVDGCFWHGCPDHMTWPSSNAQWWREKVETTSRRDRDTDARLVAAGWEVIRIWEHEDPSEAADRVEGAVRARALR